MASSVSSSSRTLSRSSASSVLRLSFFFLVPFPALEFFAIRICSGYWYEVEADEYFLFPRHVTDNPPQGERQFLDKRRGGEHEVDRVPRMVLIYIDDVERVPSLQVLLADLCLLYTSP